MKAVDSGTMRDELASRIGSPVIAETITFASVHQATRLIATLDGWDVPLEPVVEPGTRLAVDLDAEAIDGITKLLGTASGRADDLAATLIDAVGGTDALVGRLHSENPWILKAELRDSSDGPIGYARLLHVSDEDGDAHERCVELATHLLRIFSMIDATDVKVRGPGYTPIVIDGHEFGVTGLARRYIHPETQVAWRQTLMKITASRIGATDTDRLASIQPALHELVGMVADAGARFVRSGNPPNTNLRFARTQARLRRTGNDLRPPLGRTSGGDSIDKTEQPILTDDLSMLLTDFTDNVFARLGTETNLYALAAHLRGTVHGHLVGARNEPWHLIPEGAVALQDLEELEGHLWDLHDVLTAVRDGTNATTALLRSAGNVSQRFALRRAGETARQMIAATAESRRSELESAVASDLTSYGVSVLVEFRNGLTHVAVVIDLPSLLVWDEAEAVGAVGAHALDSEIVSIIPVRRGRRLEGVGLRLGRDGPTPLPDGGGWIEQLPNPHPANLGALVLAAGEAARFLSAIVDLDEPRRAHPVVAPRIADARDRFDRAVAAIAETDDDFTAALIRELGELRDRVEDELAGRRQGPTYASQVLRGVLGTATDEALQAGIRYLAALEWEIDPNQVRQLLAL